jgi:cell wall-associated NlpC family hydrolase
MSSFFATQESQAALAAELKSWIGTPFQRGAGPNARKGVCCDCISFVSGVLVNLGAISPVQWPPYVTKGGGKPMLDLLLFHMEQIPQFERVSTAEPGAVLVSSTGKALHHASIFVGNKTVWHAFQDPYNVCTGNVDDPLIRDHLVAIFRVNRL